MTPQGAIEIIKIAISEVEWEYPIKYAVAFEEAISALEKQIPKKLIINEKDGMRHCPNCDTFFLSGGKRHCEKCGQALDWSEEE
jgi:uncharacterized paraquat-inducible protein A